MTIPAQDIVERLLQGDFAYISDSGPVYEGPTLLGRDAADTISRLTADKEALQKERRTLIDAANLAGKIGLDHSAHADALALEMESARDQAKRLEHAVAFTAKMAWRTDPPNANNKLTDAERLSAIKHHPTIKRYGEPDRELAAKEAASRPLPLQETEK